MSPEQVEIAKAVLAAVATVAVAGLGLLGVVISSRKTSKDKPPADPGKQLDAFNGTQNEFMALVIADNKTQREALAELQKDVEQIKQHQDSFLGAVRRYLMKLAEAWPIAAGHMPWPDEEDFQILEETLPKWRGN